MLVRFWQFLHLVIRQRWYAYVVLFAVLIFTHLDSSHSKLTPQTAQRLQKSLSISSVSSNTDLNPQPQAASNSDAQLQPSVSVWQRPVVPTPPSVNQSTAVPVITRIETNEPVVFLGIDDGWDKSQEAKDWLMSHHFPFTLFLTNDAIKDNYSYFQDLQRVGMTIEDHTLTHPDFTNLSLDQQKAEICGAADAYQSIFGHRPTIFRPTYGTPTAATDDAASQCGMHAIVMWSAKVNGGSMQFQDDHTSLMPGDIVLMHFRPEFLQDMQAFMNQVQKDNLQIAHLEDWLP